jgi:hypothetical protein
MIEFVECSGAASTRIVCACTAEPEQYKRSDRNSTRANERLNRGRAVRDSHWRARIMNKCGLLI